MTHTKRKTMNKAGLLFNMYIYFDDSKLTYFVVLVGFFFTILRYRQKIQTHGFDECFALDSV